MLQTRTINELHASSAVVRCAMSGRTLLRDVSRREMLREDMAPAVNRGLSTKADHLQPAASEQAIPSPRLRQGRRRLRAAMGLKEFMHRKRVLGLYRDILKVRVSGDRR